ncbi:MAG: DUF3486 family protein [Roseococcus sp.]|nr:DUF3486 family protein [Roseococcus sp.]
MASRPSSIDRLPAEIREAIGRLREHGKSLDEILDHLRTLEIDVSRSALGRHVKGMAAMGERLRRSRAMAEGLARQLGETPGDKMARLNIELLHSVVNDLLAAGDEEEAGALDAKGATMLATAIERLTKAARQDQDFVLKLEERVKKDAAKTVAAAGRDQGLTEETISAITSRILGIAA